MKQKHRMASLLAAALLLALCAGCGADQTAAPADPPKGETVTTADYTLSLPAGFTAQEKEDGTVTLLLDGKEVGGVTTLSFANAEELLTMDVTSESSQGMTEKLVQMIAPEEDMASMLSLQQDSILLSLAPDRPEGAEEEVLHQLFPQGDRLYDLFFQRSQVTEEQQQGLADGFALNEKPAA